MLATTSQCKRPLTWVSLTTFQMLFLLFDFVVSHDILFLLYFSLLKKLLICITKPKLRNSANEKSYGPTAGKEII